MIHYHLAQINIGRMLGPIDSEIMAEFVANLDPVNQLADTSPGFVWRLQTEDGDAKAIQAFDDPLIAVNFSIWESPDSLREFVYKSGHVTRLRRRTEWFEKPQKAHMAMWWIPAGHIPSVADARKRLEFRQQNGDTPAAFSFTRTFPRPEAPSSDPAPSPIHYDGRKFTLRANSPNGNCTPATHFHYHQEGSRVWATYEGGGVRFGSLVAITHASGALDMRYQHVDRADVVRIGTCYSRPMVDGSRLQLREKWRWTNGDLSEGEAILEELF
jgi:hypothetical protein